MQGRDIVFFDTNIFGQRAFDYLKDNKIQQVDPVILERYVIYNRLLKAVVDSGTFIKEVKEEITPEGLGPQYYSPLERAAISYCEEKKKQAEANNLTKNEKSNLEKQLLILADYTESVKELVSLIKKTPTYIVEHLNLFKSLVELVRTIDTVLQTRKNQNETDYYIVASVFYEALTSQQPKSIGVATDDKGIAYLTQAMYHSLKEINDDLGRRIKSSQTDENPIGSEIFILCHITKKEFGSYTAYSDMSDSNFKRFIDEYKERHNAQESLPVDFQTFNKTLNEKKGEVKQAFFEYNGIIESQKREEEQGRYEPPPEKPLTPKKLRRISRPKYEPELVEKPIEPVELFKLLETKTGNAAFDWYRSLLAQGGIAPFEYSMPNKKPESIEEFVNIVQISLDRYKHAASFAGAGGDKDLESAIVNYMEHIGSKIQSLDTNYYPEQMASAPIKAETAPIAVQEEDHSLRSIVIEYMAQHPEQIILTEDAMQITGNTNRNSLSALLSNLSKEGVVTRVKRGGYAYTKPSSDVTDVTTASYPDTPTSHPVSHKHGSLPSRIIEYLSQNGRLSAKECAVLYDISSKHAAKELAFLAKNGEIRRVGFGVYSKLQEIVSK